MAKGKKSIGWLKWLGVILLIPSLLLNGYLFSKKGTDRGILVLEVLDGDTILLDGKVRLRLRQLDAPELEYCAGAESKEFLEGLVKGKRVYVQEEIIDQTGRPMALVYLGNELINQKILENGWGKYHHDQTSKEEQLKQAGDYAKENKLGLYSSDCYQTENLDNPDCDIKGNIDMSNSTIKRYYFPGCAQYQFAIVEKGRGEQWFCSEAEAKKAGYQKAKSCPEGEYKKNSLR
ncbi:MAG: thermonuclease family protein [Patescibacteria group bacterium]